MAGKTIRVPREVFDGLCALLGNPDLDPVCDFIECLQYLSRYDCYRPTEAWIVNNVDDFWAGWDGKFLEEKPDEAEKALVS